MTRGKKIAGRKRHIVVDTLGLLWSLVITPACVQDRDGGQRALHVFRERVRFPKVIWADQAYAALVSWALVKWLWCVELVKRPTGRFEVQPKRWIVERTFGWLAHARRLSKDYEYLPATSEVMVSVAMIRLMLKRLAQTRAAV